MPRSRRLAATVGLVALLFADVVLVLAAFRVHSASSGGGKVAVAMAPGNGSTTAAADLATSTTSTTTALVSAASPTTLALGGVPLKVVVVAVDASVAWRAVTGSCSGGATVGLTTDGGRTWTARTSPLSSITRVQPTDATKAFLVGSDPGCVASVRTTTNGGTSWPGTGDVADVLARDPADPAAVRAPGGLTIRPCGSASVVDLARSSSASAEILCADGRLLGSTDDAQTWSTTATVPGALAIDSRQVVGVTTTFVASVQDGCEGVRLSTVADGATRDIGCVPTGAVAPGEVALSVPNPTTGWLLVGSATWRASNGLSVWSKA